MKNKEIKEILDRLDYIVFNEIIDYGEELSLNECKVLLDYITNLQKTNKNHSKKLIELGNKITNLQQENDNLINLVKEFENKGYDIGQERADFLLEIKDLQQENETRQQDINNLTYQLAKIKQENERLKENNSDMQEEMARTWQKCDDYKSRCIEAIEIIEKEKENMGYAKYDSCLLLIENILQNGSENDER